LFAYSIQERDGRHSLWLGHVDGGEPRPLRPPAEATFPFLKFAPDGGSLYFSLTDEANPSTALFKMPAFGGAAQKIKEKISFLAFAPDGKQFAFVRQEREKNKSVLIVADMQGNERELAARSFGAAFVARAVAWSPDGKMIAVAAVSKENGEKQEIFVVRIADGSLAQLGNLGWHQNRAAEWVKDGSGLIIVAADKSSSFGAKIWHLSYPGGEARQIITDLSGYGQLLSLSADNDYLLAVQAHYHSNIWVAPAENLANAKQITFDSLGKVNGWDGLDWMPGGKIIYTARVDESSTIWAMNADGGNQTQLTPSDAAYTYQNISSEGSFIVFESIRGESREVWRVNRDGSDLRQLTGGGRNSQPHVSPDGKSVVYISGGDLRRSSTDGGGEILLAENAFFSPRFSPDGKFIAYGAGSSGSLKLFIISAEGGQPVKQFDAPRLANFNIGIRWTPDGKAVTYRDWANGIWRQNTDGGAPERLKGLPEEKLYTYGWSRDGKQFAFTRGTEIRDVVLIAETK
jgi:Tol biopolymer transport system component